MLRAEIQRQATRYELAFAQLLGVAQGAPGVVQRCLDRAGELFALGQPAGNGAGEGAAGTVVAARQALAGERFAASVAAVQAIMDFMFVAVTTGCLLYTSPSPRDGLLSRMPSSA